MANVHTLADLRKEEEARLLLTRNANSVTSSSSDENAAQTGPLRFVELIFPRFTWKSSLLILSTVQVALYIATLIVGSEFPLIPSGQVLVAFGANVPQLIAKGQVWRLFCPIFLHTSLLHIFLNVFFQLRMGFLAERRYGIPKFLLLYLFAGITGNVFSAVTVFCNSLKVGASTSGFGLIGVEMAELCLLWHVIRHRDRTLLNIIIYFIMSTMLIFTVSGERVDHLGHIGGFIAGFCLAILYNHDLNNKPSWYEVGKYVSVGTLVALYAICTPILFALNRHCV